MNRATLIPATGPTPTSALRSPRVRAMQIVADLAILWLERGRQRRALQRLDDRMLRDVGLSRADVGRETDKPFWRP